MRYEVYVRYVVEAPSATDATQMIIEETKDEFIGDGLFPIQDVYVHGAKPYEESVADTGSM